MSSSSPATAAPAAKPASLAQLKKIVLRSADVPSGWKGAPYQADQSNTGDNALLFGCVGARDTDRDKVAEANSDDFSSGNAEISSQASSYRSQSDLDSDTAAAQSPKLTACFEKSLKQVLAGSMPTGSTIESTSVKFTPGSADGPANVVSTGTGTITIAVSGQQITTYITAAFITGPLIEASVTTFNIGSPLPASMVNSLVATVANRAAKG